MAQLAHPFVPRLVRTFRAEHCVYMLMEAVMGGELFELLLSHGPFTLEMTRFYCAQVAAPQPRSRSRSRSPQPAAVVVAAVAAVRST
jgi:serine/threonine protein kinase